MAWPRTPVSPCSTREDTSDANLPARLPREASDDFSAQLASYLPQLPDGDCWERSRRAFYTALSETDLHDV